MHGSRLDFDMEIIDLIRGLHVCDLPTSMFYNLDRKKISCVGWTVVLSCCCPSKHGQWNELREWYTRCS